MPGLATSFFRHGTSECTTLPGDTLVTTIWRVKCANRYFWRYTKNSAVCENQIRTLKTNASNGQFNESAPSPHQLYQQSERSSIVAEALQKLSEEQRTIIIMKEYEGLKFREIAELLNISENTAKSRLYYGLKNLRKILDDARLSNELNYE